MNRLILASVLAAAVTSPTLTYAGPAPEPVFKAEKCFGLAKAGQNDCGVNGANCAGLGLVDADPQLWIYVPVGYCDKIIGGSKAPKST